MITKLFRLFFKIFRPSPKALLSWEPKSNNDFRRRVGFIDRRDPKKPRTKADDENIRAQREALFARIQTVTERTPVDQRVKCWPHEDAVEFRAEFDGRAWRNPPPIIERARAWTSSDFRDFDSEARVTSPWGPREGGAE